MILKHILPAVFWGVIIFLAVSIPPNHIPESELLKLPFIDKAIHLFLFFIFSVLIALGLYNSGSETISSKRLIISTLTIGIFYSAATELLQFAFLPEREGSIFDFLANAIGTIFGVLFFVYFIKPLKLLRN
jgi:VanZ family protein